MSLCPRIRRTRAVLRAAAAALTLAAMPCHAQDYEIMTPYGLGSDAVDNPHKTNFITNSDTFFVDGKVHSVTIDKTTYDRALVNVSRFGANHLLTPKLSARWFLLVEFSRRTEEGKETPRIVINENTFVARPRLEFTYYANGGLEIFGGATYWYVPEHEKTSTSVNLDTVTHVGRASMFVPHLGVVKRGSGFAGGAYYKQGTEANQDVRTYNSLDKAELKFTQKVYDPTRIAIFFNSDIGKNRVGGEFAAVQASEGGNRTDNGDTIAEDYMVGRLEGTFATQGNLSIRTTLLHKTLSYADNRNVSLPAISMTALHAQLVLGVPDRYSYFGLAYGLGKDRQSIPEFNADYSLGLYGFSAGLGVSF